LTPGAAIAHYRITAKLGEGGMGEVWRATDTRLNRDVAIKVLPAALANDAQYMARFEREAQTLAALNHPNIAAIYGIEQGAIVMELVEGETLPCPVALETALDYARQIAVGLEAAHEKGIVHRDLKPANVKITPAGVVKLLDFGLAKSAGEAAAAPANDSPTLSLEMTQAGMILGTAAYMAPEQARGKPVDKRADIWSFGVVLYEMLTGKQLFGGETIADTLASVVKDTPDLSALPEATPPHIRRLLDRCLRKDPAKRLRDIGEARMAIDEPWHAPAPAAAPARRAWLPWAVAALVAIAGGAGWWRATRPRELLPLLRFTVELGAMPLAGNLGGVLAVSRDGSRVAVVLRDKDSRIRLHTRSLQQGQLTPLPGTEDAQSPFFSPDGNWIGFAAGGKLVKISAAGGPPLTLCDARALRGASWGDDGNIIFAPAINGGLWRVSSDGGAPVEVSRVTAGERTHRWPDVLPGSQVVLFTSHGGANDYDNANIEALWVKTGQRKLLRRGGFSPLYAALPGGSGRLFYQNQGTVFAAPFDAASIEVTGEPAVAVEEVHRSTTGGALYALSTNGTLLYVPSLGSAGDWQILWADASGRKEPLHALPGAYYTPRFSPDGKRLAFAIGAGSRGYDLWVKDLERDTLSRLSSLEGVSTLPVWTPDGRHIIFRNEAGGKASLYWVRSDGAGEAVRLTGGDPGASPYSIAPDGKRLAVSAVSPVGMADIFTAAIEGDAAHPKLGPLEVFRASPVSEAQPAFSPDGRWLAHVSAESGTVEVYVRPFPGPGGRWQISTGGGQFPVWSRDGRELLYRNATNQIAAVSYTGRAESFTAGKPRLWSPVTLPSFGNLSGWDLAPDGKRMAAVLTVAEESQAPATHAVLLLNFLDELQRKAK
jgi:serine/threonine-protein kinase